MVVIDMTAQPHSHAHHADVAAFIDLVNSLEFDDGVAIEHLPTVRDATDFFVRRNLAHAESLTEAAGDERAAERRLARLRAVRTAAREVFDAVVEDRGADEAAIERLNEALRHRPLVELTAGRGGCGVGHRHVGDPWDEAVARILEPFVQSVAEGDTDRFRICANDGCRWIFQDESRAGRRRWCDMSTCGNRAKAARHRARQKAGETAETGEASAAS
jgi:predicted RNA-binding Zn ribbon-like protein